MLIGKRIKDMRLEKGMSQQELGDMIGVTKVSICGYENGTRTPSLETFCILADIFDTTTDYLLGREDESRVSNALPDLNKKDTRDIARDLEKTLKDLENSEDALMFDGEPIDEHTKEMIRISLENSMRMAKQLAKQKFTPNKYKKD